MSRVSYPGETDSLGFATPVSLTGRVCDPGEIDETFASMTPQGMIPGKTDYVQYNTQVSLTHQGIISRKVMYFYGVFRKNLIVLFIVSFESDEMENSIFLW